MNNSLIKKIALENGFNLKKQLNGDCDLHPYVYAFANKLLEEKQKEIEHLRMILWFVKDHFDMNGLDKAMPRVYEKLKDATTHIVKSSHNTSCTYQFELAFLHLQDTPELRKMYWSALGQLQFDSNDQVIPPELEECPCCKQAEEKH
ncbi:hypothetical protein [Acinetobacter sp. M5A5_2a]